ncbi:hypothetical protein CGCSCA5_v002680 [Colletotrichum siamense]|nr:hypothetical protein CGCSCA5_v002680 [Colletotrichum siamense]
MVWLKKTVLVAAVSLSGIAQAQSTTSSTSSEVQSSTSSELESSTLTFTNSSSTLSSSSSSLSSTSGTVSLTSTSTGSESETSTSTGAAPASTSSSVTPSVSLTPSESSTGGAGASSSAPGASSSAPAASSNAPGASSSAPGASSEAPGASSQAPPASSQAPGASSQAPGASSQAPPASSPAGSSPGGGGAASTPAASGGSTPSSAQSAAASASASSAPGGNIAVLSTTPQAFNNFLDIQPGEAIVSTLTINGQAVNYVIVSQGCRGVPAGQSPFADGTGPESGTAFTPGSCAATCAGKGASMSGAQRGICNCGNTLRTDLPLIAPAQCKASNNAKRQTGTYDPVPIAQAIPASQVAIQQASVTLSQSSLPVVAVNTAPPGASVPASTTAAGSSAGSSAATSGAPGSSAASTGAGASTGAPAGSSAGSSAGASAGASTGASSAGATPASSAGGSPAVSSPAAASATDFILGIVGGRAPSSSVSSSSASSSRASSASSSSAASSSASSSRASSSSASSASSASASSASSSSAAASSSPIITVPTSSLSITSPPVSVPSTSTFNFANTTSVQPAQKRAILKRKIEEVAKRQTGAVTYVGRAGSPNPTNCQQASVFRLGASGTLTIDGAAFGVNPGVFFAPLRTGQTGSIVATFTAVTGSGFAWTNPSFFGGQAGFCQDATGQVYATFANPAVAGNVPSGCTTVSFNVIPSSQCAPSGTTLSASSTTPVVSPPVSTPVVNPTTTPVVSPPVSTPVVNPTTTGVAPTGTGATTIVGPSGTTIVGPSGTTIIGPSGTSVVGPSGTDTGATATSSGAVTTVAPNPGTIGDYASLGCFSSGGGFPSFLLVKQDNALTIDSCIAACGGSKLIGVFGTDCYCGSFIDNSQTQQVSENQCNTQCPGNPLQRCGGRSSVAKRQAVPAGVLLSIYIRIDAGSISTVVSVSVSAGIDTTASFTFTTVVTDPGVTVTAGVPSQTPNVVGTLTLPPGLYTEGQPTPTGEFCRITTGSWYIGSTTLLPFPLPTA